LDLDLDNEAVNIHPQQWETVVSVGVRANELS
jgi:hypothetical protein